MIQIGMAKNSKISTKDAAVQNTKKKVVQKTLKKIVKKQVSVSRKATNKKNKASEFIWFESIDRC